MAMKLLVPRRGATGMNRCDLVLSVLASSEGRPYTPAQLPAATYGTTRRRAFDSGRS